MSDEQQQPTPDVAAPAGDAAAPPPSLPPEPVRKVQRHRWIASKLERMECWPDVLALIENNEAVPRIAAFIHDQRQEYLDATREGLESALYYWIRKDKAISGARAPTMHMPLIASTPGRVDPLDALNLALTFAVERAQRGRLGEARTEKLTHSQAEAIRLIHDISKTMADVESKRRRYAPPPPTAAKGPNEVMTQIDAMKRIYEQRYGDVAARVILKDESRRRVLNALERVRKGDSDRLMEILNLNEDKANELQRKAERAAADEAAMTIEAEVGDAG